MKYLLLNKNEIEKIVISKLQNKKEIEFAYFFGSIVRSDYYHDIDIAIYLTKNFNYNNPAAFPYGYESLLIGELSAELKTGNIDVVLLNKTDLHLFKNVINTGQLLFERNRLHRINCENRIRYEYSDTEHFRKIQNYYLKKKIEIKCLT